jgi:hypothetical protein
MKLNESDFSTIQFNGPSRHSVRASTANRYQTTRSIGAATPDIFNVGSPRSLNRF